MTAHTLVITTPTQAIYMMLATSEIYYSPDSISNKFGKSTEYAGVLIGETSDKILTGDCSIFDINTIQIVRRNSVYYKRGYLRWLLRTRFLRSNNTHGY